MNNPLYISAINQVLFRMNSHQILLLPRCQYRKLKHLVS